MKEDAIEYLKGLYEQDVAQEAPVEGNIMALQAVLSRLMGPVLSSVYFQEVSARRRANEPAKFKDIIVKTVIVADDFWNK